MSVKSVSVLGAGWLGLPLAVRLAARGLLVRGSTTTPEKLEALTASGVRSHWLELKRGVISGDALELFFDTDLLVFTLPPSGVKDYEAAAATVCQAAERYGTRWLIMTSSTSVYPDLGRAVAESDAGAQEGMPLHRNGDAVLSAERVFKASGKLQATVLRLAGLYGHGRHPARYLAGRTDLPDGDAPVNLVHRDDVIGVVEAVITAEARGDIYNVCADRHPTKRTYYPEMARRLGLEPPAFAEGATDGWKRVSNEKLKERLGYQFSYPDPLAPAP